MPLYGALKFSQGVGRFDGVREGVPEAYGARVKRVKVTVYLRTGDEVVKFAARCRGRFQI